MVEISTTEMLNEMLENMKVVRSAMTIIERQASQIKELESKVGRLLLAVPSADTRHVDECYNCGGDSEGVCGHCYARKG